VSPEVHLRRVPSIQKRVGLLVWAAALTLLLMSAARCTRDQLDGYVLSIQNDAGVPILVDLDGRAIYDGAGVAHDPAEVTIRVEPGVPRAQTPFAALPAKDGSSTVTVRVLTEACSLIGEIDVTNGRYALRITADEVTLTGDGTSNAPLPTLPVAARVCSP